MRDHTPRESKEAPHGTGFSRAVVCWCIFGAGVLVGALVF